MLKRAVLGPQRRTNPLIWFLAFVFAIVFMIIIIAGIVIFVGYLTIRPKVPLLYVKSARLDQLDYGQAGVMAVRIFVIVKAENHNMKAHVSFYDTDLILGYHGLSIAKLVAGRFEVKKNTSQELFYVVESSPIPLSSHLQDLTEQSLDKSRAMPFFLKVSDFEHLLSEFRSN
uniref:NDR1/HIN1-like protein 12 n=1 Tax=Tanacetum cinerariifolium TaxID=118510 RepID=A0A699HSB1_TANCI|nr:NDR1/HIN1-like protein 12 [Tanacetum cinerariifolium]